MTQGQGTRELRKERFGQEEPEFFCYIKRYCQLSLPATVRANGVKTKTYGRDGAMALKTDRSENIAGNRL